ncbi:MscS mechanosensitive ion channel [Calothrix parasitica NIES-267]|uniref:MscS mechanosensitive ion channel n=1 Tax=Calothrix parasitica NIES-267 TaxID=1973488 RepID=A0A1Z4LS72_9CYAN|nr:MscS mechanosensitive ion channel [Calothrix parasitica NIES-267]
MVNRLTGLRKQLRAKAFILISLLTFSLIIFTNTEVQAGSSNQNPFTNASSNQSTIVYAPITLDGREIVHIAARKGISNNLSQNTISPLDTRVEMYEEKLSQILATGFNPKTLYVTPAQNKQQTVILVGDTENLKRRKLMSVTELDAQLHGLSITDLAGEYSKNIRPALIKALQERQPETIQQRFFNSLGILAGIILLTALLVFYYKKFVKKEETLQQEEPSVSDFGIESENAASEAEEDAQMMEYCQKKLIWQRKLNINRLKIWILVISLFMLWVSGLAAIVGMFPYTRWLQDWLLTKPLLLAIILSTILGIKASDVIIDFLFRKILDKESQKPHVSARRISRLTTFSNVIKGAITFIWMVLGILWFLEKLHIPIIPILAGAGIVGFAVSFSSQNLIRDIINGIIMLWEDQFIIGDLINVSGTVGVVENVNLRMIQLRQANGILSTISNSSISTVHNLTKDWSRIVFTVDISPEADIDKALGIVRETACGMQTDEEWKDSVLDPVNVLGVNNISSNGIEIMLWFKTEPGAQFALAREFRRRLKYAFDRENIDIGIPQNSLQLQDSPALRLFTSNSN